MIGVLGQSCRKTFMFFCPPHIHKYVNRISCLSYLPHGIRDRTKKLLQYDMLPLLLCVKQSCNYVCYILAWLIISMKLLFKARNTSEIGKPLSKQTPPLPCERHWFARATCPECRYKLRRVKMLLRDGIVMKQKATQA